MDPATTSKIAMGSRHPRDTTATGYGRFCDVIDVIEGKARSIAFDLAWD